MGFIKGSLNLLVPVNAIKAPISQAKSGISVLKNQVQQIFNKTELLKEHNLSSEDVFHEMSKNKQALFAAWGMDEGDEIRVKKGLLIETFSYMFIAALPVAALLTDLQYLIYWIATLAGTPLYIFVALTKLWRYECICAGHLTPFKKWIFKN